MSSAQSRNPPFERLNAPLVQLLEFPERQPPPTRIGGGDFDSEDSTSKPSNSSPESSNPITWSFIVQGSEQEYLKKELSVKRINDIHHHLWWAGRPGNTNPLHKQRMMLRNIVITENPVLHLVWFDVTIYIKPMPDYLLDYDYFKNKICPDSDLYPLACGFLYSYTQLIRYKSDHAIAIHEGLLPEHMDWLSWCKFSADIRQDIHLAPESVNKRYRYGELRLRRLNQIYRFVRGETRGFQTVYTQYAHFFQENFAWLLFLFAFLSIVLTAMQLIVSISDAPQTFLNVSYYFGLISIGMVVGVSGLAAILFVILFGWNVVVTLNYQRVCRDKRRTGLKHLDTIHIGEKRGAN